MIGFLRGKIHYFNKDSLLIDVNDVGYRVNFTHPEILKKGEEIIIYTYQSVSENDVSLYGFRSIEEYEFFVKLISVKGIGPKMASNMLGAVEYSTIIEAIENEDIAFIKSMPGIGAKTASQIILDLRGKLAEDDGKEDKLQGVVEALKSLGYKPAEIKPVIKEISKEKLSEDEYVKKALSKLIK